MATQRLDGDVVITGALQVSGNLTAPINRSNLINDLVASYPLELQDFRIWDAFQTSLTTAANDDLGITAAAFGTGGPYIHSGDLNALGAYTRYARTLFTLPPEYVSAGAVQLRFCGGQITSVASVSSTVDVEAYLRSRTSTAISGSDLVTTAATSINSTTFAEKTFDVTSSGLSAGSILDIRIALIGNSATASSHFAAILAAEVLLTVKG